VNELQNQFEKASRDVRDLPDQSNDVLLKLYALFKQATVGDVEGKRPGIFDLRGRAKFDAWAEVKGQSKEQAMKSYIAYVSQISAQK